MIFQRSLFRKLKDWKERTYRKPLILRGARQVGKTTLVHDFSSLFDYYVPLNLEKQEDNQLFESANGASNIFDIILLSKGIQIEAGESILLFIDEIQENPKAVGLLRYFYEELPHVHVIAAGSLLEFVMKDIQSFPVGRVEYLYLYPFNFEEFLSAVKHESALKELNTTPVNEYAHKVLLDLFNTYMIIGGMPEVVSEYIRMKNFSSLPRIYESVWESYINDVEKYGSNNTNRNVIRHIMRVAPKYIDQPIKYQNFGNSNYKSREVSEAFTALDKANVIHSLIPSTSIEFPIIQDFKKWPKIQLLDTGIVNYSLGIIPQMIPLKDMNEAYRGAIVPHMINQEVLSLESERKSKLSFWVRDKTQSSAEVDLILSHKGLIFPIEIKSGATGSLKSLHQFVNKSPHPYAIRIYGREFEIQETRTPEGKDYYLMNLPYYLGTQIYKYMDYFLETYPLKE